MHLEMPLRLTIGLLGYALGIILAGVDAFCFVWFFISETGSLQNAIGRFFDYTLIRDYLVSPIGFFCTVGWAGSMVIGYFLLNFRKSSLGKSLQ